MEKLPGVTQWLESYKSHANNFVQNLEFKTFDAYLSAHAGLYSSLSLLKMVCLYSGEDIYKLMESHREESVRQCEQMGHEGRVHAIRADIFYMYSLADTLLASEKSPAVEKLIDLIWNQTIHMLRTADLRVPYAEELVAVMKEACQAVIAALSRFRIDSVCSRYRNFVYDRLNDESNSRRRAELLMVVDAIGGVQFQFGREEQARRSVAALKLLNPMSYTAKHNKSKLHHAMCAPLTNALLPVIQQDRASYVASREMLDTWQSEVSSLKTQINVWMKSDKKHIPSGYPILSALTCLLRDNEYQREAPQLVDQLHKLLKDKTKTGIALKGLKIITFSYIQRMDKQAAPQLVVSALQPTLLIAKKGGFDQDSHVDLLEACVDSCSNLGETAWRMWEDLLAAENLDLSLIVLKSLQRIVQNVPQWILDNGSLSSISRVEPQLSKKISELGQIQTTLELFDAGISPLAVYGLQLRQQKVSQLLQEILHKADGVVGNLVEYRSQQDGGAASMAERDKHNCSEALICILKLYPYVVPTSWENPETTSTALVKYCMHSNPQLKAEALHALQRLMTSQVDRRVHLLQAVGMLVMQLPQTNFQGISNGLELFQSVVNQWYEIILMRPVDDTPTPITNALNVNMLEGCALLCLCSPYTQIRKKALEILCTVKQLHQELVCGPESLFSTDQLEEDLSDEHMYAIDVIEQEGNNLAKLHFWDFGARSELESSYRLVGKNGSQFTQVLMNESGEGGDIRWARLLNELGRYGRFFELGSFSIAYRVVCQQLKINSSVKLQSGSGDTDSLRSVQFQLWQNYVMFATGAMDMETGRQEGIELLDGLVKELKNASEKQYSDVLCMGLGNINDAAHTHLFQFIKKQLEENRTSGDRNLFRTNTGRKSKEDSRSQMSEIMRLCVGHMNINGNMNGQICAVITEWLTDTRQFLDQFGEVIADSSNIKYCLCRVVLRLSKRQGDVGLLDHDSRLQLFRVFHKWAVGEVNSAAQSSISSRQMSDPSSDLPPPTSGHSRRATIDMGRSRLIGSGSGSGTHDDGSNVRTYGSQVDIQVSALCALGGLLGCNLQPNPALKDLAFKWINSTMHNDTVTSMEQLQVDGMQLPNAVNICMDGLKIMLQNNPDLLSGCVEECYSLDGKVAAAYFQVLGDMICMNKEDVQIAKVLCLIMYKLVDSCQEVRDAALDLLKSLAVEILASFKLSHGDAGEISAFVVSMVSGSMDSYMYFQNLFAQKLAVQDEDVCRSLCLDVLEHLQSPVQLGVQQKVLRCLRPWLQQVNLGMANDEDVQSMELLQDILNITYNKGDRFPIEIQGIWEALANSTKNAQIILSFLIERGNEALDIQNDNAQYLQQFLQVSKKIVLYISRVNSNVDFMMEYLVELIVKLIQWKDESDIPLNTTSYKIENVPQLMVSEQSDTAGSHRPEIMSPALQSLYSLPVSMNQSPIHSPSPSQPSAATPIQRNYSATSQHSVIYRQSSQSSIQERSFNIPDSVRGTPSQVVSSQLRLTAPSPIPRQFKDLPQIQSASWQQGPIFPPNNPTIGLCFLSEIAKDQDEQLRKYLPLLLHLCIILIDSPGDVLPIHCLQLLLNLLYSLSAKHLSIHSGGSSAEEYGVVLSLMTQIQRSKHSLWEYEDRDLVHGYGTPSRVELQQLVVSCLQGFKSVEPDLVSDWSQLAFKWGLRAYSRHLSCRSLQVFSAIGEMGLTGESCHTLIYGVHKCLRVTNEQSSVVALEMCSEILQTLDQLLGSNNQLLMFPQVFWAAVGMLRVGFTEIYCQALDLILQYLQNLKLCSSSVSSVLLSGAPAAAYSFGEGGEADSGSGVVGQELETWKIGGVLFDAMDVQDSLFVFQQLLIQGMCVEASQLKVIQIIKEIACHVGNSYKRTGTLRRHASRSMSSGNIELCLPQLFGNIPAQLITSVLILIPYRFGYTLNTHGETCLTETTNALIKACTAQNLPKLAQVLEMVTSNTCSNNQILVLLGRVLREQFFAKYSFLIMNIFNAQLEFLPMWQHHLILMVLKSIFDTLDMELDPKCPPIISCMLKRLHDMHANNQKLGIEVVELARLVWRHVRVEKSQFVTPNLVIPNKSSRRGSRHDRSISSASSSQVMQGGMNVRNGTNGVYGCQLGVKALGVLLKSWQDVGSIEGDKCLPFLEFTTFTEVDE